MEIFGGWRMKLQPPTLMGSFGGSGANNSSHVRKCATARLHALHACKRITRQNTRPMPKNGPCILKSALLVSASRSKSTFVRKNL